MAVSLTACPRCGAQLEGQVTYCPVCGINLSLYLEPPHHHPSVGANAQAHDSASSVPFDYRRLSRPSVVDAPLSKARHSIRVAFLWTLGSTLLLLVSIWHLLSDMRDYNRLVNEGVTVQAIITRLEEDDDGDTVSYSLYYQFEAPFRGEIKRFQRSQDIPFELYNRLKVNQRIEVIYWPKDPKVSSLKSELHSHVRYNMIMYSINIIMLGYLS